MSVQVIYAQLSVQYSMPSCPCSTLCPAVRAGTLCPAAAPFFIFPARLPAAASTCSGHMNTAWQACSADERSSASFRPFVTCAHKNELDTLS
jgi:hypothetical protein